MTIPNIIIPYDQLADFCRRHRVRELALFGSVLGTDFRPDSDIDVLVDFEGGKTPKLKEYLAIEAELGEMFQREVDLVRRDVLEQSQDRVRRDHILKTAQVIYRQGSLL